MKRKKARKAGRASEIPIKNIFCACTALLGALLNLPGTYQVLKVHSFQIAVPSSSKSRPASRCLFPALVYLYPSSFPGKTDEKARQNYLKVVTRSLGQHEVPLTNPCLTFTVQEHVQSILTVDSFKFIVNFPARFNRVEVSE